VITVEALRVENLMSTPAPKPDPENEGQFLSNGASAKSGLNKSIADASWSMLRSVLMGKAESADHLVVAVNPAYASQTPTSHSKVFAYLFLSDTDFDKTIPFPRRNSRASTSSCSSSQVVVRISLGRSLSV
jgi:hypothetical protein